MGTGKEIGSRVTNESEGSYGGYARDSSCGNVEWDDVKRVGKQYIWSCVSGVVSSIEEVPRKGIGSIFESTASFILFYLLCHLLAYVVFVAAVAFGSLLFVAGSLLISLITLLTIGITVILSSAVFGLICLGCLIATTFIPAMSFFFIVSILRTAYLRTTPTSVPTTSTTK